MLDDRVVQIADAAAAGNAPTQEDVVYLLGFDAYSPEAAYVGAIARRIGMRACEGRGFIHAQIGVDSTACPKNCRFCSFAAVNVDWDAYDPSQVEVPLDRIVHYAKLFDEEGVDLVSLMATAALDFDRYLEMVRAVRANVSDTLVIMANAGDLTSAQAQALKEAGANAAYHALRLDEGEWTGIKPADRLNTICAVKEAGLDLMTGVEPVWDGAAPAVLAERICEVPSFEPFSMGACGLTEIEGADVFGRKRPLSGFLRYVGACVRLVCGEAVPIGGIGGVAWVDAGCDPRRRGYGEEDGHLRRQVARAARQLEAEGFAVGRIVR